MYSPRITGIFNLCNLCDNCQSLQYDVSSMLGKIRDKQIKKTYVKKTTGNLLHVHKIIIINFQIKINKKC